MATNKKVKIVIGSILGLAFLFSATLFIHIAIMVSNKKPITFASIQMERVDFTYPLDSAEVFQIEQSVRSKTGVKSTYFNYTNHILVYTFDNRLNNPENIYNNAIKSSSVPSKRHIVSADAAQTGCPAMINNSFYGKLTTMVSKLVN